MLPKKTPLFHCNNCNDKFTSKELLDYHCSCKHVIVILHSDSMRVNYKFIIKDNKKILFDIKEYIVERQLVDSDNKFKKWFKNESSKKKYEILQYNNILKFTKNNYSMIKNRKS